MKALRRFGPLVSTVATLCASSPASADPPKSTRFAEECAHAAERGQRLRNAGDVIGARLPFTECARRTCPALIRTDCTTWLDETVNAAASVILHARDASGEVNDVIVTLDGEQVADHLDGQSLSLNPGNHTIACTRQGGAQATAVVSLIAGDHDRPVEVRFPVPPPPAPVIVTLPKSAEPPLAEAPSAPVEPKARRGANVPAWIAVGTGAAAFGTAAYLGITGLSTMRELYRSCDTNCPARFDDASTRLVWANVSLVVGLVASGAATYFFITGRDEPAPRVGRLRLVPSLQGAAVQWERRF